MKVTRDKLQKVKELSKFERLNKETFRWARVLAVCVATAGKFKGAALGMLAGTLLKTPEAPRGSPAPP